MRKPGQTNTSKVPLSVLVERLTDNPNIQIVVSNKFLKQTAEVLGVDFSDYLTETTEAVPAAAVSTPAPAAQSKPVFDR